MHIRTCSPQRINYTSKKTFLLQYIRSLCVPLVCLVFVCTIFLQETSFAKENQPTPVNTEKKSPSPAKESKDIAKNQENTEQIEQGSTPKRQYKADESFGWPKYFQATGTMLFLLVLLWYGMKILRKYGSGRFLPAQRPLAKDSLYLEGQIPLGHGKGVVVVKVLDKRLILGVTEHSINLLIEADIDDDDKANFQNFMEEANSSSTVKPSP